MYILIVIYLNHATLNMQEFGNLRSCEVAKSFITTNGYRNKAICIHKYKGVKRGKV